MTLTLKGTPRDTLLQVDEALKAVARVINPNVPRWWFSRRPISFSAHLHVHTYHCYICDWESDPDYHDTRKAIGEHRETHHEGAEQIIAADLRPISNIDFGTAVHRCRSSLIPHETILGVRCVTVGVQALFKYASENTLRAALQRILIDQEFHDALDAATAVPNGVIIVLQNQGLL